MVTVSHILCPIDLSDFSRRSLALGLSAARSYGARVTALHVRPRAVRPLVWGEDAAVPVLEDLLEGPQHDAAIRQMVADIALGAPVAVTVRDGAVAHGILAAAREVGADLIVMGTHGAGGFERLMMGSVTERVLRTAECPVLTVPRDMETPVSDPARFKMIACGLDLSPASQRAFEYALSLAQETQGRLLLVHVFETMPPEHEAVLRSRLDVVEYLQLLEADTVERLSRLVPESARPWCEPEIVVRHGKPHTELVRLAQERGADLLVLGVHGRNRLDLALFGSTTNQVLRQATCPVLTVPPHWAAAARLSESA